MHKQKKYFHNKNGDYMEKKEYQELIKKHLPNENKPLNSLKAFIVGGLIGILGNFLLDFYSYIFNISTTSAGVLMMTTFIFFACLFTALGFFDNFVKFARMGVIIPITGFAHSVQSSALDYKNEGLIYGIGSNILKLAGSVILYGVVATVLFSAIRLIVFGG